MLFSKPAYQLTFAQTGRQLNYYDQMRTEQLSVIQPENLRAYQGGFFRVLVSPQQTDGRFALIDTTLPKGSEPPRHLHTREDETFYLLEGRVTFEIGDTVIKGQIGQAVFAPRHIEHQFTIQTDQARMLTLLTPGDFVNFFIEFSLPTTEAKVQPLQGPPPPEAIAHLVSRLTNRYGTILSDLKP